MHRASNIDDIPCGIHVEVAHRVVDRISIDASHSEIALILVLRAWRRAVNERHPGVEDVRSSGLPCYPRGSTIVQVVEFRLDLCIFCIGLIFRPVPRRVFEQVGFGTAALPLLAARRLGPWLPAIDMRYGPIGGLRDRTSGARP